MKSGYGKQPETGAGRGFKVAFDSARVERTLLSVAFDVDLRCHHENLDDKTWDTGFLTLTRQKPTASASFSMAPVRSW
jgi:hypothetical protein